MSDARGPLLRVMRRASPEAEACAQRLKKLAADIREALLCGGLAEVADRALFDLDAMAPALEQIAVDTAVATNARAEKRGKKQRTPKASNDDAPMPHVQTTLQLKAG